MSSRPAPPPKSRERWRTSDSFVQVPPGLLLVTGAQRLAIGSVEEAVVVEGRLPVSESDSKVLNVSEMPHAVICGGVKASPGGITHAQGFPLGIPSRVWDLLVSRLGAFKRGRSPQSPLPLSFGPPAVAVSSAPEGHVHQTLAAGSQLWIRAPAGKGRSGFGEEAEEVEEESDGHLSVSGCISHLG